MDTQADAGVVAPSAEQLHNSDVRREEFDLFCKSCRWHAVAYIAASAIANLVEKIQKGDRAGSDAILRSWGVRE